MAPGELWAPSRTRGAALFPELPPPLVPGRLGMAEGGGAGQPPPRAVGLAGGHGVGQRPALASLPPCSATSRTGAAGLAAGFGRRAAPCHHQTPAGGCSEEKAEPAPSRDPAGTPLLPLLPSSAPGKGRLLSPLEETCSGVTAAGALLAPLGPAATGSPVPSPSVMLCTLIFFKYYFYFNIFVI